MLTPKQQRFVAEFSLDRNASRAARAAGYGAASARVTASRLLAKANIRAAVALREREAERELEMTRQRVLAALAEAFELAKQKREPATMIAACRAVAQICGYYQTERHAVELSALGDASRFEAMTDDELLTILGKTERGVV
jgi:phage terminase small subunit